MKIEEERKRFERTMVNLIADKAFALHGDRLNRADIEDRARNYIANLDEAESAFSVHFALWLAAKEDAKPVMDVYERSTHCGKAWTYANAWGGKMFNCKDAAIEDALQSGFRFKGAAD